MKIIYLSFGFADVFLGEGWESWTRIRVNKKTKHIKHVAGKHLSAIQLKKVYSLVFSDRKVK